MSRFEAGEVAWITGGSSGIGLELARKLAAEGVIVALSARRAQGLEAAVEAIRGDGGAAHAVAADVTDTETLKLAAKWIASELGRCDMAAPLAGSEMLMPLDGMTPKRWQKMLDVHVTGAMEMVRHALPLLREAGLSAEGQGRVAFLSSTAAMKGWPGQSAYAAAKGAQIAGMRSLAAELAPAGIRVNALAAGLVRTPLQERMFIRMPAEKRAEIERAHLLGVGDAGMAADALMFLLSRESRWITGACLTADGGQSLS